MSDQLRATKLIGRGDEYAALLSEFETAIHGQTRVTLVSGEPGIGKTRLLLTFAEEAERGGAVMLRGGASEAEGMPPYLPFLEGLGRYIRAARPEDLRARAGSLAPILTTIFPELIQVFDDLPVSYPLPPEQARLRLFEAVGTFMANMAGDCPVVFLLDDLQWADSASLDLLTAIVRYQPAIRLLVLGAYREGEGEGNAALERAIRELNRQRTLRTVHLRRMTADQTASLSANYLGAPLDPAGNDLLFAQSEGNPFFAEELLRGWLDGDALRNVTDYAGRRVFSVDAAVAATMPASIVAAVRERLVGLDVEVVETLRTAAVIGRTFERAVLAAAAGEGPDVIELRLTGAVHANLIQHVSEETFAFRHDKIRECLYGEVSPYRRQRLHGLIGHALETTARQFETESFADLAYHYARSGDHARGADYSARAGEQAMTAYAPAEAMAHFKTALDLIPGADDRRGAFLLRLGEAASLAGDERQAATTFGRANAWFTDAGQSREAARASLYLGRAWWRQEEIAQARSAFESARSTLRDRPGPELVEVLVDLSSLLAISLHELDASVELAREALRLAELLEDERLLASSNRTLGSHLVHANDLAGGVRLLEHALDLAIRTDDLSEAAESCAALANAYFWQGAFERSRAATQQRMEFARLSHDPYQMRHVYPWLAIIAGMQGRVDEARGYLEQAEVEILLLASPEPLAYVTFCRAGLAYFTGNYAQAKEHISSAVEILRQIGPHALVWYLGLVALVDIKLGRITEAIASLREVDTLVESLPVGTMPTSEPLAYLTEAAIALGDHARLDRYYPQLKAFEGQFHDFPIDRLLGHIETLRGEFAAAGAHLSAAAEMAAREGMTWETMRVAEAQAGLILARDGAEGVPAAREHLQSALRVLDPSINPVEYQRLQERLRELGVPARVAQARPGGLSPREVDVIRLVAAGKSNREIAGELFISEKTVINHLTHIFNKLGVDNRAAAAAFAVRNDLA